MGNFLSNSEVRRNNDKKMRRLEEQLKMEQDYSMKMDSRMNRTHWNGIPLVWSVKEVPFGSSYEQYKGIGQEDKTGHYDDLRPVLNHSEGIEAVMEKVEVGSVYDAPFDECGSNGCSITIATVERKEPPATVRGT